jgi:hypothetical protein
MPAPTEKPRFMTKDNTPFEAWYAELRRIATERCDELSLAEPPEFWHQDYERGMTPKGAWAYAWGD